MKHCLTLICFSAALLAAPEAAAWRYATGYTSGGDARLDSYSHGSGYSRLHIGRGGGSISKSGAGNSFGCCPIDAPHRSAHQQKVKRAQELQAQREAWFNANPPCGLYNRAPAKCKRR